MEQRSRTHAPDHTTANLVLIFVNMIWIFLVVWGAFGLGAVAILGAFLNHLITRLEFRLRQHG
ncbi:histidinol phosphate aminotransferase [Salipiger sp.]|uniref:histidinol phosphate aminotransferase n=1 Tax=Salipiger sp. TaxID=2078585 RepID=UPI003A97EEFB